jgi:hypothetical protein
MHGAMCYWLARRGCAPQTPVGTNADAPTVTTKIGSIGFLYHRVSGPPVIFRFSGGETTWTEMQSTLKPASSAVVHGLGNASHTSTGTLVRLAESGNISKFSEKALFGGG